MGLAIRILIIVLLMARLAVWALAWPVRTALVVVGRLLSPWSRSCRRVPAGGAPVDRSHLTIFPKSLVRVRLQIQVPIRALTKRSSRRPDSHGRRAIARVLFL